MTPFFGRIAAKFRSFFSKKEPQIQVEVDVRQLRTLAEKINRLGPQNSHIKQGLNEVGVRWTARIKANFRTSQDPYGNQWAPIKHRKGQPLIDTARLVNSIKHDVRGLELVMTSPLIYAETHNFGSKDRGIKRRAFLPDDRGLPKKWSEEYETIMAKKIEKALG